MRTNLHDEIMNLRADVPSDADEPSYRLGHRDARHAAAELVSALAAPPQTPQYSENAMREVLTALWDMQQSPDCWCDAGDGAPMHSPACAFARDMARKYKSLAYLTAEQNSEVAAMNQKLANKHGIDLATLPPVPVLPSHTPILQTLADKWDGEAANYDARTDDDYIVHAMMLRYCAAQLHSAIANINATPDLQTPRDEATDWTCSRCGRFNYKPATECKECAAPEPVDAAQAIADMEFARDSHLKWAEHLEAHVASGVPCEQCDGKPYKLNAAHERDWVAKYDRVLALLRQPQTPIREKVEQLPRYDLITNYRCGSSIEEMERADDGEWVRVEAVLQALCAETPQAQEATCDRCDGDGTYEIGGADIESDPPMTMTCDQCAGTGKADPLSSPVREK